MVKKQNSAAGIFTESIGLYFSNFGQFMKYMTFPVLGQILGLILVIAPAYFYSINMPYLVEKYQIFDNFSTLIICIILITLPGMIIFLKAFWEYLVAYGALNSMFENMLKSGKVYDFNAHTELIKRRSFAFVILWLIIGIFGIFAACPIFWFPAGVLFIYFVLLFQIFTFEPNLSIAGVLKKSFTLIKGHFAQTFGLVCAVFILTYVALPNIFLFISNKAQFLPLIINVSIPVVSVLPLDEVNSLLSYAYIQPLRAEVIAEFAASILISQIIVQYTLPLRTILWCSWYRNLNGKISDSNETKNSSGKKRPSEKLMKESHKRLTGD